MITVCCVSSCRCVLFELWMGWILWVPGKETGCHSNIQCIQCHHQPGQRHSSESRAGCTLNSLVSWSFLPGFDTMFSEELELGGTVWWIYCSTEQICQLDKIFLYFLYLTFTFMYFCRHFYPKRLIQAINVSFINTVKYIHTDVSEQDYFKLFALKHCWNMD